MGHLTDTAVLADLDNQALALSGRLAELKELQRETALKIDRHESVLRMIADAIEMRRGVSLEAGNGITADMATGYAPREPQPSTDHLPVYPKLGATFPNGERDEVLA